MTRLKAILLITPLTLFLLGCAAEDEDATVLQGTWQSEEFTTEGNTGDITYNFNGDNFKVFTSLKVSPDTYTNIESTGDFKILDTITTDSGLEAYQVNFTYKRDKGALEKKIIYIDGRKLYLGNSTKSEACEGDTYTLIESITQVVNESIITNEVSTCYIRPTSLNLSFTYNKKD
ncbi:hypothetical protein ACU6U9_23335 [Pseudomonas sp. HK3]|jgi:hypothetical protein